MSRSLRRRPIQETLTSHPTDASPLPEQGECQAVRASERADECPSQSLARRSPLKNAEFRVAAADRPPGNSHAARNGDRKLSIACLLRGSAPRRPGSQIVSRRRSLHGFSATMCLAVGTRPDVTRCQIFCSPRSCLCGSRGRRAALVAGITSSTRTCDRGSEPNVLAVALHWH